MKRLFNSVWIISLAILGFGFVFSFSYLFLFYEELQTNDSSVEDQLVSDESWIKQVLFSNEHNSNQVMYSQKYGEYLFLEQHCNKTLTESSPKFTKLVLMIIDALRVDFIPSIKNPDYSTPRMSYVEQLIKTHGFGLQSIASIPTVTLARVKAILSGCLPSFMDYIMNLNAYSFQNDNIVTELWKQNKSIVFYGDDIWGKLFNQSIFHRYNLTSSMFARDFTEVDTNVTYNVNRDLTNLSDWDVMLLHYLGVDHIGHLYGYNSDLFPSKLNEMDDVFRNIFDTISFSEQTQNESYLILITGDHGMTKSGNHGGNTREETHTALVFVSTNKSHVFPSGYRKDFSLQERTILQIDIASTIAALFSFSFPSKSQGRIISPVLERFDTPKSEHLCLLFQNAFHIQHFITRNRLDETVLKNNLVDALSYHYKHVNVHHEDNQEAEKNHNFEISRDMYQQFIHQVQQQYVKTATNRSFFSVFTVLIVLCFMIIFTLLYIEYVHNSGSVFFSCPFNLAHFFNINEWFPPISPLDSLDYTNMAMYFSHLRFFASSPARCLMAILFSLNVVFMGSTNFMEYEHLFWHYLAAFLLVINLIFVFRGYFSLSSTKLNSIPVMRSHYVNVIVQLLVAIALFKLMLSWKIPLINENDLHYWDIQSWIIRKESKHALTAIFLISLFVIGFFTSTTSSFGRPPGIFILALACVYSYHGLTGSIGIFKILLQFLKMFTHANFWANAVYAQVMAIILYSIVHKVKRVLPMNNFFVKIFFNMLNDGIMMTNQKNMRNSKTNYNSLLHCFLLIWVIMSTLLMDVSYVPLLALNILLEKLVYFVFSTCDELPQLDTNYLYRQMFYRLGTYLIFAYSSFYQIGNTNGLSTISVNSCFVGLSSYMLFPCTIFMVVSIYSTYIYWLTMFFIRMQQDIMPTRKEKDDDDEEVSSVSSSNGDRADEGQQLILNLLARKDPIVLNYCVFYSIINCVLIIRLLVMTMNMAVTFCLREHLFIWSVVCPKLLYEIVFTFLNIAFAVIISAIFTHDNHFSLH